jgi:hypothetical protein
VGSTDAKVDRVFGDDANVSVIFELAKLADGCGGWNCFDTHSPCN